MGIKKFINSVKESLGLNEFKKYGKKKSLKHLLEKLKFKKDLLYKKEKKKLDKKEKKELKEELAIITLHIKKGEKILNGLNNKSPETSKKKKEDNGRK